MQLYSCSLTKYVGDNEYLLYKVKVATDNPEVKKSDIKKNIRQKPNTRILGAARLNLALYNLSGRDENKRFNKWMRNTGEAPVIYNGMLTRRSSMQIESYLNNRGYYNAIVKDTVRFEKKKVVVEYVIKTGEATRIESITLRDKYNYAGNTLKEDSELFRCVQADTAHMIPKAGDPVDLDVLEQERMRIARMLKEKGYFNFSKNFIQYYADTTVFSGKDKARILLSILDNPTDSNAYKRYKIGRIKINYDYDPLLMMRGDSASFKSTMYMGYEVRYRDALKINPKLIIETMQFKSGDVYNIAKVLDSYSRLQALQLFRFVNIAFTEESGEDTPDGEGALSCEIQLTLLKRQSYSLFLEGTHNTGNIGVGGNVVYDHRNLFKGGENFSLSFWGALKKEQYDEGTIFNTREIGVEAKLITPQFWMPFFRMEDFRKRLAPKTSLATSYSNEHTPFYNRRIVNAKFGYFWRKENRRLRYNVDVADFNYVMMSDVDSSFLNILRNEYIKSAYKSHLILSAGFSVVYSDQVQNVPGSYNYFRSSIETSGNLLRALSVAVGKGKKTDDITGSYYEALGIQYAQFVKADVEYKFNHYINNANTLVYRFLAGCGYPYGNMKALPFEEAFFVGGANGIRAWPSRSLGPGSYVSGDRYPNNVGDFKLEANIEYRYKLFWLLEGALFLDAGNIWNINKYENRKGTMFGTDFYKQIAVGSGLGLRLDANVFVLRFDWGIKIKDPGKPEKERFVLLDNGKWLRNTVFNIAIGYPF